MSAKTIIFIFLLVPFMLKAQVVFKTIVPQQPVVAGESFQVQYIIQGAEKVGSIKAPAFIHFRFVSGPNQYNGSVATMNGTQPSSNFVFTLEATKPGRFIIPGAMTMVNGRLVKSNDVLIEVIPKEEAAKLYDRDLPANADYVLRPGEDPYEKIRQNLFLKVMVDRTNCFAGEPVLATFKLYSRLESRSDIVKNPGFYGFTVYDMVNLSDKQVGTENVNGKIFDVHTIRKVQLYPLQAGVFAIDAMEVKNKIEFSRSIVNKKTEQEIVEGVLGNNENSTDPENKEIVETSMSTEPVSISVKPVPVKNKPEAFGGAVGDFGISASLANDRIAKNEGGAFEITIKGSGNFTQVNAPRIDWPAGIEAFEPIIKDSLDKTKVPLTGSRTFRYAFVCTRPGNYQLPPVSFSFFDPDSNTYKMISTIGMQVAASNEEKINTIVGEKKISMAHKNAIASRIAAGIVALLVLVILIYWIARKKEPTPVVAENKPVSLSVDQMLAPAYSLATVPGRKFYIVLHQCIWDFFGHHFKLSGSEMSKENLLDKMKTNRVPFNLAERIQNILQQCEESVFTTVSLDADKTSMLLDTKEVLESIHSALL